MNIKKYIFTISIFISLAAYSQSRDSELLGKALEYYGGQKYHEALLVFEQLRKTYKLNPRFLAYTGVCYFKEQRYEEASDILDKVMPELTPFPPHERALYYFANAESHFFSATYMEEKENGRENAMKEYDIAATSYEKALEVCYAKEKGDIYYRLGFCHLLNIRLTEATDYFSKAKSWYARYGSMDRETSFRKKQTENMLRTLLVTHGTSRMDERNKETWQDKNENADNKGGNIQKNK